MFASSTSHYTFDPRRSQKNAPSLHHINLPSKTSAVAQPLHCQCQYPPLTALQRANKHTAMPSKPTATRRKTLAKQPQQSARHTTAEPSTNQPNHTAPFNNLFSELPPEFRNLIYDQAVLDQDNRLYITPRHRRPFCYAHELLQVNRQIHQESSRSESRSPCCTASSVPSSPKSRTWTSACCSRRFGKLGPMTGSRCGRLLRGRRSYLCSWR